MPTEPQKITKAKGRPLLSWVGKKPLDKIEYYPICKNGNKSY